MAIAGRPFRSFLNRPTNSAAICWESAALPPLPQNINLFPDLIVFITSFEIITISSIKLFFDLINTFKYLKLSVKDFENFIENKKKSSWRYRNDNVKNLFWLKYQANSLVTFNNSKNFEQEILEFIENSSPLLSAQLAVPKDELQRLIKKFNSKSIVKFSDPEIIIINKRNPVLIKSYIEIDNFCKKFEGQYYDFYYNFNLNFDCNN